MTPAHSTWQRRRSEFNHQWLKNRFLSALDATHNIVAGRIQGRDYLEEMVRLDLPEWPDRRAEIDQLLDAFTSDASPSSLFSSPPFSHWEEPTRQAICELTQALWLARNPLAEWTQEIRAAAAEADRQYESLSQLPLSAADGAINPEFGSCLEDFRSACRTLARAIEQLPSRMTVA